MDNGQGCTGGGRSSRDCGGVSKVFAGLLVVWQDWSYFRNSGCRAGGAKSTVEHWREVHSASKVYCCLFWVSEGTCSCPKLLLSQARYKGVGNTVNKLGGEC